MVRRPQVQTEFRGQGQLIAPSRADMYGTEKKVMKLAEPETRSGGDLGECREKMRKEIHRAALILINIHVDSDPSRVVQLLPIPAAL